MFKVCILQFSITHCVIIKYMLNIQNLFALERIALTQKILVLSTK